MRALILSAGLGERLRPLTLKRAKPAIEFLNIPMLAFPYFWLDSVGLASVVFNTHYLPESVRHAAMNVVSPNSQLHFLNEDNILGSGGGIWNARFDLAWDSTFAVANADGVVAFADPATMEHMLRFHEKSGALATLLVCPLPGVGEKNPGVWLDKYGEVCNFGKAPKKDYAECLHYASYMFLSKRIWDYLPEGPSNILYDVLEPAIAKGEKVFGFREDNMRWFETGNAADYLTSTQQCLEYLRADHPFAKGLREMLERFAPRYRQHSDFANLRLIDDSAEISAAVRGFAVIGADSAVHKDLENSVVLPGSRVESSISGVVV